MTVMEAMIGTRGFLHPARDRAIGEEAEQLREQLDVLFGLKSTSWKETHYREVLRALEEACQEAASDNWDGYGAHAVDPSSQESALVFLHMLPDDVPAPEVSVDPDGDILLFWAVEGGRSFAVSVGGADIVRYAGVFGRSRVNGTEEFGDGIPRAVATSLARLFAGTQ